MRGQAIPFRAFLRDYEGLTEERCLGRTMLMWRSDEQMSGSGEPETLFARIRCEFVDSLKAADSLKRTFVYSDTTLAC